MFRRSIHAFLMVATLIIAPRVHAQELEEGVSLLDSGDYSRAADKFNAALEKDIGDAAFYLGKMYEQGWGFEQNTSAARAFFERGRDLKSPLATLTMGYLAISGNFGVLQNHENAFRDVCAAGELGNQEGIASCGRMQVEGFADKKDVEAGLALLGEAAREDNLGALNYLGHYYSNTENPNTDPVKAFDYYSRAAAKFDPYGMFALAGLYENGVGTAANLVDAHVYYNISNALAGIEESAQALQRVTSVLTSEQLRQAQLKASNLYEEYKNNQITN